ncbi:MAG: RidA/YER057c/UK114 superfamily protein, partial [uncultured Gemmatimonadetes bacterium]
GFSPKGPHRPGARRHRPVQPGHRRQRHGVHRRPDRARPPDHAAPGGRRGGADRAGDEEPARGAGGGRLRPVRRGQDDGVPARHERLRGDERGVRPPLRRPRPGALHRAGRRPPAQLRGGDRVRRPGHDPRSHEPAWL